MRIGPSGSGVRAPAHEDGPVGDRAWRLLIRIGPSGFGMAGADEQRPVGSRVCRVLMRIGPSGPAATAEAVSRRKWAAAKPLPPSLGLMRSFGVRVFRHQRCRRGITDHFPSSGTHSYLVTYRFCITTEHCTLSPRPAGLDIPTAKRAAAVSPVECTLSRTACPGSSQLPYHLVRGHQPPRRDPHVSNSDALQDPPHDLRRPWHCPRRPAQLRPHRHGPSRS